MKTFFSEHFDKILITALIVAELSYLAVGHFDEKALSFWQGSVSSLIAMLGILLRTKGEK